MLTYHFSKSFSISFLLVLLMLFYACQEDNFKISTKLNDFQKSLEIDSVYYYSNGNNLSISDSAFIIVSWNIQQGRYIQGQIDYLKSLNPDIVCLQEVDWNNKRTNYDNIIETYSNALNMYACYAIEFIEIDSEFREEYEEIGRGGGATGNAILSKSPLYDCKRIPLSTEFFDWNAPPKNKQKIIYKEPRIGQRIALIATTTLEGQDVRIVSTHLEDKYGGILGRVTQLKQIINEVEENIISPTIIAGDLNTYAHGAALIVLGDANNDSLTQMKPFCEPEAVWLDQNVIAETDYNDPFNKHDDITYERTIFYKGKLDWILLNKFNVINKGVSKLDFSDHKAIWVEVTL